MEKLIRVHKLSIETRINEKLSVRHPLFAWLVADQLDQFLQDPVLPLQTFCRLYATLAPLPLLYHVI